MEKTGLNPVQIFRLQQRRERFRGIFFYLQIGLALFLLTIPFLTHSFEVLDVMIKIIIFSALVASYDILIGFTGVASLGHTMYFGIGAYLIGIFLGKLGLNSYGYIALAFLSGIMLSGILSILIGFFSLRIRTIFFAMVTLAFLEFVYILSSQLRFLTGGEDGLSYNLPGFLANSFRLGSIWGLEISGRLICYYLIICITTLLFLVMHRFVHSPLGRVLLSIRDNEQRATALGYRTTLFHVIASTFASCVASVTGGCFALWVGFVSPESTLGVPIMMDVLLMVIVGGMGTLYGGFFGASFLIVTRAYLPKVQGLVADILPGVPWAIRMSQRWLFFFGLLFILIVYFFPKGAVGTVRDFRQRGKADRL